LASIQRRTLSSPPPKNRLTSYAHQKSPTLGRTGHLTGFAYLALDSAATRRTNSKVAYLIFPNPNCQKSDSVPGTLLLSHRASQDNKIRLSVNSSKGATKRGSRGPEKDVESLFLFKRRNASSNTSMITDLRFMVNRC
jgi:hypothetical protein